MTTVCTAPGERDLLRVPTPLALDRLVPGEGPWEVELGFGKGRYLLAEAAARPRARFLGVEVAAKYYRLACRRGRRRGLDNVALIHGEALYLMSVALPTEFAAAVHVYFPDPWPKSRHQKRRLFDPETVDLLLGLLEPGGHLCFATDYLEYGELVTSILASHPGVGQLRRPEAWPEGPRTNYEAKYVAEGRPVIRLVATRLATTPPALLHPAGERGVLAAFGVEEPEEPAVRE